MIELVFEAHGTTLDNEAHKASGWHDVELSPLGEQQSKEMGERYKGENFDIVFCSDLSRAYMSGTIAFSEAHKLDPKLIYVDWRLRECDYGDMTQHPSEEVDQLKVKHITEPFPNGESYEQAGERIKSFLEDLIERFDNKRVMVIGHRATQFGIEHWINGKSYDELTTTPFKWQPGWNYKFEKLYGND